MNRRLILAASGVVVVAAAVLLAIFAREEGVLPPAEPPVAEAPQEQAPGAPSSQPAEEQAATAEAPADRAASSEAAAGKPAQTQTGEAETAQGAAAPSEGATGKATESETAPSETAPGETAPSETASSKAAQSETSQGATQAEGAGQPSETREPAATGAAPVTAQQGSSDETAKTAAAESSETATQEPAEAAAPAGEAASSAARTEQPQSTGDAPAAGEAPAGEQHGVTIALPTGPAEPGQGAGQEAVQEGSAPTAEFRDQSAPSEGTTAEQQPAGEQQAALPDRQSQEPQPRPPGFDIVRVEGNGDTVVAGSAVPGSVVTLLDGAKEVDTVVADRNGNWVMVTEQPLSSGSHELTLRARQPDGAEVDSDRAVIVVVPERPRAIAKAEPESATEGQAQGGAPEKTAGEQAPGEALALLVPRGEDGAAEVMQEPSGEGLQDQQLVLSAVDYDQAGRIVVSGRAVAGAIILVFLDGRPIGRTFTNASGRWVLAPVDSVTPGLHRLRVDQVKPEGGVVASVETPFSRAQMLTTLPGERFVIVQPGNSLWRIARRTYGEGIRYTVIYRSNQGQIRDPDLIYPGQVFLLPELQ